MTNFNKKDKLEAVIFTFGKKTRENDGKKKGLWQRAKQEDSRTREIYSKLIVNGRVHEC